MAECFIGRQPIFNRSDELYAYELLYRRSERNEVGTMDMDVATSQLLMNTFVEIGLENIVGDRLAFINMTRQFLLVPELLAVPPEQVVLEIPALSVDEEVRAAVGRLKETGHTIALNDFRAGAPHAELLPLADFVKIDAIDEDEDALRRDFAGLGDSGVLVVAKRVETRERQEALAELGCDYFQGYYLARPSIVSGRRLPTKKMAILQLLAKISDPRTETGELVRLIAMDAAFALRVLRFVNSPLSGVTRQVDSIQQAVVFMGRDIIKNWVMLLTICNIDDVVPELVTTALVRARLCQLLAAAAGLEGEDSYFTVGLFSLVDAMMSMSTEEMLAGLPFTEDVKAALLDQQGTKGEALICAQELEMGAPMGIRFRDLEPSLIADLYAQSLQWADEAVSGPT